MFEHEAIATARANIHLARQQREPARRRDPPSPHELGLGPRLEDDARRADMLLHADQRHVEPRGEIRDRRIRPPQLLQHASVRSGPRAVVTDEAMVVARAQRVDSPVRSLAVL